MRSFREMKNSLFLIFFISFSSSAQELIPIGDWRSHFNYNQARIVTEAGNRIYCATDNGLFYFDQEDNSINRLSRTDGLSDVGISAMAYSSGNQWLFIGYESGNIDLYSDEELINLTQIFDAEIIGSKRINHVSVFDELAYVSTDFGMVVIDLARVEIRETYRNLGPAGELSAVRGSVIKADSIYLATDFGVIFGNITGVDNLLDFQNWSRIQGTTPVADQQIRFISGTEDVLVAATNANEIFLHSGALWQSISVGSGEVEGIAVGGDAIYFSFQDQLRSVDIVSQEVSEVDYTNDPHPSDVLVDMNGTLWVSDTNSGLYSGGPTGFQNFVIPGPASNDISKLYFFEDRIYALHGIFVQDIIVPSELEAYSLFSGGSWEVVSTSANQFANHSEIIGLNAEGLRIASFGNGLFDVASKTVTDALTEGSVFEATDGLTLLTGVDADSQGNLWVSNYNSSRPLHRRDPQGNWTSFSFNAQSARFPVSLSINELDDIWMRLDADEGGGVLVFNAEELDGTNLLSTAEDSGNLPSSNVTDVAFDREGQVWIGTDNGISFIPNPIDIFEESGFDAIRPIFENRFLLEEEFITSIAIDGGNRKWIGTKNGIWLFSSTGEELVSNYTVANAPLPDNLITDIEVNPNTGEVFIATSKGLVSVRGTATEATKKHRNVKIFPNPVRPGYTGEIGISGLSQDAVVKITDIGGRLIKELRAAGGTAIWDGAGFGGRAAESGIYLVFSASLDGEETFVGKIAIVR